MDFASHFRGDGLSQNLGETGGFRRRELGVVEGRKPRSVRISSSEVNLDLKTSRDEINEEDKKKEESEMRRWREHTWTLTWPKNSALSSPSLFGSR